MGAYYLGAFFGSKDFDLKIGRSADGITFTGVGTFYDPYPDRGVRDPSIAFINGVLWVAYTPNAGSIPGNTSFSLAYSLDGGRTFTRYGSVDCSAASGNTGNSRVWAPEWFQDVDLSWHILVTCSTDNVNFYTYELHPTGSDFSAWSAPAQIASLGGQIDAFIYWDGAQYNAFVANGVSIGVLRSASPFSAYSNYKTGDWAGWGHQEGPCILKTPTGYRIYMDDAGFGGDGTSYSDATTIGGTWSALALVDFPDIAAVGDNRCDQPRNFHSEANALVSATISNNPTHMGPNGVQDGYTLSDTSDTVIGYISWGRAINAGTEAWIFAQHFRKTSGALSFPVIELALGGGTGVNGAMILNTDTGAPISANYAPPGVGNYGVEDAGDYWRAWVKVTNNGTNTNAVMYTQPAAALPSTTGARNLPLTGSCVAAERSLTRSATITPFTPLLAGGQKVQHGSVIRVPALAP